jgi:hypothetical protein
MSDSIQQYTSQTVYKQYTSLSDSIQQYNSQTVYKQYNSLSDSIQTVHLTARQYITVHLTDSIQTVYLTVRHYTNNTPHRQYTNSAPHSQTLYKQYTSLPDSIQQYTSLPGSIQTVHLTFRQYANNKPHCRTVYNSTPHRQYTNRTPHCQTVYKQYTSQSDSGPFGIQYCYNESSILQTSHRFFLIFAKFLTSYSKTLRLAVQGRVLLVAAVLYSLPLVCTNSDTTAVVRLTVSLCGVQNVRRKSESELVFI